MKFNVVLHAAALRLAIAQVETSADSDFSLMLRGLTFTHVAGSSLEEEVGLFCQDLEANCTNPPCPRSADCRATVGLAAESLIELSITPPAPASSDCGGVGEEQGVGVEEPEAEAPLQSHEEPAATASAAATSSKGSGGTSGLGADVDLAFEVVVKTDGTRARFEHRAGSDAREEVEAFCAANVGGGDAETCRASLLQAVAKGLEKKAGEREEAERLSAAWRDPDSVFNFVPKGAKSLELEVAVDAKSGASQVFRHSPGQDPTGEAQEFCKTHLPHMSGVACSAQLVKALEGHLTSVRDQEALAAANGQPGGAGGGVGLSTQAGAMQALLGPSLVRSKPGTANSQSGGEFVSVDTSEALKGAAVVGLYFAADWCPPCRQFTPMLAKYRDVVKNYKKRGFEVVWASASRAPDGYKGYLAQMPWPAVPYEDRQRFEALRARYQVKSFPTLVFVDAKTGQVVAADARDKVAQDPRGDGFPYAPPAAFVAKFAKGLWQGLVPAGVREKVKQRVDGIKKFVLA